MNLMEQDISIAQYRKHCFDLDATDWVMYNNQSHSLGAEIILYTATQHSASQEEGLVTRLMSQRICFWIREATAGWEKQFRNKSPSPPVAHIKWSRSVAFPLCACYGHTMGQRWVTGLKSTDPTLQLAPSLPKLTLRFSPKEEVRARRRSCPSVSTANPFCYF